MNRVEKCLFNGLIIIAGVFTLMFLYKRSYCNLSCPIDSETIGQYGDFIGGAIGTFITLLLLYVTFKLQRETFVKQTRVADKNIEMLAIQQLNDKFFKLYEVYKDILSNLSVQNNNETLISKSALSYEYATIYAGFNVPPVPGVRRKAATLRFVEFYASHKEFAPIYFRTLYHMYEELERAEDVALAERQKYVRLLRSQFTETELVFMRYNAMTPMGENSIEYINKYNLMKHLPPMELMEYKGWRSHHGMSDLQVNGINTILLALKSNMIHALSGEEQMEIASSGERYEFTINTSNGFDRMEVVIKRDTTKRLYPNDVQYEGLEGFSLNDLKDLLSYYVKDCIVLLNFNRFNVRRELNFESVVNLQNQLEIITVIVSNNVHRRLAISYGQYKELNMSNCQDSVQTQRNPNGGRS